MTTVRAEASSPHTKTAGRVSPKPRWAVTAQMWLKALTTLAPGTRAWMTDAPDSPAANSSRTDHTDSRPSKLSSRYGLVASIRIFPSSGRRGTICRTACHGTVSTTTSLAPAACS
jgi:hypothetical protein